MPTPTPTFIKGKHKPTPYPHSSKPWVTEYGHGSKASKKPFVEKAPPAPLEAHEPVHPFRDINRPDGNYGPPGSACDRRLLSRLRKRSTLICPPNACPPFEEALPMRLPEATTDASLVLNPHYDGPGMPRFAVVFYPKVYGKEKVMDFYRRSRDLTFDDTAPIHGSSRRVLLGLSTSGYIPTSSDEDLNLLRSAIAANLVNLDTRLCNTDRATREAMKAALPRIKRAVTNLGRVSVASTPFPENGSVEIAPPKGSQMAYTTSMAVSWGGWDWTTFSGDHTKHYTFVIPLCFGTMGLGDLGSLQFKPGDVIALLAGQVPHSLRSPEGQEGYVITCWTQDRAMRLVEYETWLREPR